jgi:hypothetical protein
MTRKLTSGDGGAMPEPKGNTNKKNGTAPPKEKGEAMLVREADPGIGHNSDMTKKALLVSTYLSLRKEEGAHFVKRCQVIVNAEDELPSNVFKEFCKEVDLPRNSSMFRKARTIAQAAPRLLAVADRLPDARSTLYELAKVEDETVFTELIESSEPITAARVKAALPNGPKATERCVVRVDATPLRNGERLTLLRAIKEAADMVGANVKVPKSFRTEEGRP